MDEREKKLPQWAQELIRELRLRVEVAREQITAELVKLRPQVEKLRAEVGGLRELLDCAAKGGHTTAGEIVNTLADWSLQLVKDEEPGG